MVGVYAGWAMAQTFFSALLCETIGFASLEEFIVRSWKAKFLRRDAHDLLAGLETWMATDISGNDIHNADVPKAQGASFARSVAMPLRTDLYFTPEDSPSASAMMLNAEYRPNDTIGKKVSGKVGLCSAVGAIGWRNILMPVQRSLAIQGPPQNGRNIDVWPPVSGAGTSAPQR